MPVIFVGHGSPMNALNNSKASVMWKKTGEALKKPKAILAISAHWYVNKTFIQSSSNPTQIYDMYGFPDELYKINYPVKGDMKLTERVLDLLGQDVAVNNDWGIDHGTWSALVHMFPDADIPIVQMSIDKTKSLEEHYTLEKKLAQLREEGFLILASGNIVHNLRKLDPDIEGRKETVEFDNWIKESILSFNIKNVVNHFKHPDSAFAVPTPDHYIPLIYALAASDSLDKIDIFNNYYELGSISMTSYIFNSIN